MVNPAKLVGVNGFLLSPGWLDIQVNGYAGVDFNSAQVTVPELERARLALRSVGVTRFLPTIITAAEGHMLRCLELLRLACEQNEALDRALPAFHLEGPFISKEDGARGAHPLEHVRAPDAGLFAELQAASGGRIRLLTMAPDWSGSPEFISDLVASGVRVALGHTNADSSRIKAAVDAGASLSTHLGNGLPARLPRHPNPLWDQLADERLAASFIFDGHHLPDSFMKVAYRQKAPDRFVLTSDAVALAGQPAGVYDGQVGGKVELHVSGRLTVYGQEYLAGSASSLLDGVNIALKVTGAEPKELLQAVTTVPERLLGLEPSTELVLFGFNEGRLGVVQVGEPGERLTVPG